MFWYALPAFQAGLLVGLMAATAFSGPRRALKILTIAVWCENLFNFGVFWFLVSRGLF
jgi:hypothetical protein